MTSYIVFRDGANPAFQAAVGDAISLSVRTPRHLYYMGLLEEVSMDEGTLNINQLVNETQVICFIVLEQII